MTGNTRTKTFLILVGTLVLGMVLGALLTGLVVRHRLGHLDHLRTPTGFTQEMMQSIEPTGPEQKKALREAVSSHARRMKTIREHYRKKLHTEVDSMHRAAEGLLTPQQERRLREKMKQLHREGESAHHDSVPLGWFGGGSDDRSPDTMRIHPLPDTSVME